VVQLALALGDIEAVALQIGPALGVIAQLLPLGHER